MSKTQIIAVTATVITVVGVAYAFSVLGSETALFERFPDLDPKLVVKTHRKMVRAAVSGAYRDFDPNDESAYDKIFMDIYNSLKK